MYAFGAVFAEVRVDRELGEIRVARVTATYGAGRILNHKTALSQLHGGIVWGIGMALEEETLVDTRTGRYITLTSRNTTCRSTPTPARWMSRLSTRTTRTSTRSA